LQLADLNNDGRLDVVVTNSLYAYTVDVLLGNGDGTFQPSTSYATSTSELPRESAIADFNGDGIPDLAVGGVDLDLFFGKGDGTFGPATASLVGKDPFLLTSADFNLDGNSDLMVYSDKGNSLLLGDGTGHFKPPALYAPVGIPTAADLDGDGLSDLVVTTTNGVAVLPNTRGR
jgi:hypothetical protein